MSPYKIQDFKNAGLYEERDIVTSVGDIRPGRVIEDIPDLIRDRMYETGGGKWNDASRADSSVITSLLRCGLTPQQCYATFANSPRGKDAVVRKNGHFDDYLQRTIKSSMAYLKKDFAPEPKEDVEAKHDEDESQVLTVNFSKKRTRPQEEGINVTMAKDIETEKPRWLWDPYIPAGKITILAGDPGMGKSTIAVDLVSRISQGSILPSSGRTIHGTCIIASAEDAPEDTITPRLIAANANLTRAGVIREVKIGDELCYLSLPRDLNRLRDMVIKNAVRMLVVDPLNAFLERGTDTYKDQDIRSVLAPLENMAEETGVAILIIAHLNKKEDSSVLYRVGGSIGFIGAARSVLAVATSPKGTKVMYSLKSNLSKKPVALAYETKSVRKQRKNEKDWRGEDVILSSVIRWKGETDFDPSKGTSVAHDKAGSEAENFLRQVLVDSEMDCEEIFAEAKKAGIPKGQLISLKTELGVIVKKGRNGLWNWSFPTSSA